MKTWKINKISSIQRFRKYAIVLMGVIMIFSLFGCGRQKYSLHFDSDAFESKKTSYAAGERVTVYYDLIASDTDYTFYSEDTELGISYNEKHGYVLTFRMPDHDVTLKVKQRNSMDPWMEEEPETEGEPAPSETGGESAVLSFHSFDGGGPEFKAFLEDESVVSCEYSVQRPPSNEPYEDGTAFHVVFTLSGLKPGETKLRIEERSSSAGNYDREYIVYVDELLDVSVEEGTVTEIYEEHSPESVVTGE